MKVSAFTKLILLIVFLFSSVFDICFTPTTGDSDSSSIASLQELSEGLRQDSCAEERAPLSEPGDHHSSCAHCSNCHLWVYDFPVQLPSRIPFVRNIIPYSFSFKSPLLDSPKRPPKTIS